MESTIIGVFETRADADQVRDDLLQAGFDNDEVTLISQPSTGGAATTEHRDWWESVKEFFGFGDVSYQRYHEAARRGHTLVSVRSEADRVDEAVDIINRHNPIDLDRRAQEWTTGQPLTSETSAATPTTGVADVSAIPTEPLEEETPLPSDLTAGSKVVTPAASSEVTPPVRPAATAENLQGEQRIPIVEEHLRVGKRREERGHVRVFTRTIEEPVEESVEIHSERVRVERRPADRPANPEDIKERAIEATEVSEQPVVAKEARVVGEVVVSKDVQDRKETVRDTVRRTDVQVESDADRPLAEYGAELASDQRFKGRRFDEIESDARRGFEARRLGDWDRGRDIVRQSYDRASQRA